MRIGERLMAMALVTSTTSVLVGERRSHPSLRSMRCAATRLCLAKKPKPSLSSLFAPQSSHLHRAARQPPTSSPLSSLVPRVEAAGLIGGWLGLLWWCVRPAITLDVHHNMNKTINRECCSHLHRLHRAIGRC